MVKKNQNIYEDDFFLEILSGKLLLATWLVLSVKYYKKFYKYESNCSQKILSG